MLKKLSITIFISCIIASLSFVAGMKWQDKNHANNCYDMASKNDAETEKQMKAFFDIK
jgi:hypothetical protein